MVLNCTAMEVKKFHCPFFFDVVIDAEWYVSGEGWYTKFHYVER